MLNLYLANCYSIQAYSFCEISSAYHQVLLIVNFAVLVTWADLTGAMLAASYGLRNLLKPLQLLPLKSAKSGNLSWDLTTLPAWRPLYVSLSSDYNSAHIISFIYWLWANESFLLTFFPFYFSSDCRVWRPWGCLDQYKFYYLPIIFILIVCNMATLLWENVTRTMWHRTIIWCGIRTYHVDIYLDILLTIYLKTTIWEKFKKVQWFRRSERW